MTSQQTTVVGANVALTWLLTWQLTSAFDLTRDPTRSTVRPDPVNDQTRPGQRVNPVNDQTRPGQRVNPVNGQTRPGHGSTRSGSTVNPTRSTRPDPVHALPHAPNLLVAREGACEGFFRQFWYLQICIEIPYNVVYRFGMFEVFIDMKIRIEP